MKIFEILYFSDFKPLLLVLGGLFHKHRFYKKSFFLWWDFFLHQSCRWKRTPRGVLDLFLICQILVFHICIYLCNGELRELCAKYWNSMIKIHGEIIWQSCPLLTSIYSGPIVHWNIGTLKLWNTWTLENWNIGTFQYSISILWHQLLWYCLSDLEWHL